jgi:phage virion morphogenesis protein
VTGTTITITSNADQIADELQVIAARCGNLLPAMQIIGQTVLASVQKNFLAGGRPNGWQALSPVTLAMKKGGSILITKGMGGGLLGSIHASPAADHVLVGTDKVYAAIHQFGGQAGRGQKVTIPARPFLMVQDEDWPEMKDQLSDYILMGR